MHYNPFELYAKFSIVKLDWENRRKLVNSSQSRNGDRANERDCVQLRLSFANKYWFTLHNYLVSSYKYTRSFFEIKSGDKWKRRREKNFKGEKREKRWKTKKKDKWWKGRRETRRRLKTKDDTKTKIVKTGRKTKDEEEDERRRERRVTRNEGSSRKEDDQETR